MSLVLIWGGIVLGVILLSLLLLLLFLRMTEYRPADRTAASFISTDETASPLRKKDPIEICSWNVGYGGLGQESDFFMAGGKMTRPPSQSIVEKNLQGIRSFLCHSGADIWMLQEVDIDSTRSGRTDQFDRYREGLSGSSAFAFNFKCPFVPFPFPPMARVQAGNAVYSHCRMHQNAIRVSLPCAFRWPVRMVTLKRCLLLTRFPLEGEDKELVMINLHLEAFDSGKGKERQTEVLLQVMQEEYAKGNYVIAGGDFNQSFPGALEHYPLLDTKHWTPGTLENKLLPCGWHFAADVTGATCRATDKPLHKDSQLFVIDGFILSPNVELLAVQTVSLGFSQSDHNPVRLQVRLKD